MADSIVRTVQCPYCLRHAVNVTYEAVLDADLHRIETEVGRAPCSTPACIGAKLPRK